MSSDSLLKAVVPALLEDCYRFYSGNIDELRFPAGPLRRLRRKTVETLFECGRKVGVVRSHFSVAEVREKLSALLADQDRWEKIYTLLPDEYSRRLLVDLIRFRLLGARHVKLATNNPGYWAKQRSIDSYQVTSNGLRTAQGISLNKYSVPVAARRVELFCHPLHVLNTYLLEQYACRRTSPPVEARSGDIVIDAGGCWGDSALYFAANSGPGGRVYTFEFVAENLELLQRNLDMNPGLQDRISIVRAPLWSASDQAFSYSSAGPGSRISSSANGGAVRTISLDDFVDREKLDKVDFIKMDIEGAEFSALQGATATLRRFRPRLAISVYHYFEDLERVPRFLHDLGLGYRFALDHFTIFDEETILFAVADK